MYEKLYQKSADSGQVTSQRQEVAIVAFAFIEQCFLPLVCLISSLGAPWLTDAEDMFWSYICRYFGLNFHIVI